MCKMKWLLVLGCCQLIAACSSRGEIVTGTEGLGAPNAPASSSSSTLPSTQDVDQDGVADSSDLCENSSPAAFVDDLGCEIVTGVIEGLQFDPNETELSAESEEVLGELVRAFKRYPELVLAVEGHTDNRGSAADNLELSKQRVLSVVRYMVANGIAADRIKPYGYGESRPRAANATAAGREQNRRIEINIVNDMS